MRQICEYEQNNKIYRGSDYSLKLGSMKVESQVIADQKVAVNKSMGLAHTARHATGIGYLLSGP